MQRPGPRARPLALEVGTSALILLADDVNTLLESIESLLASAREAATSRPEAERAPATDAAIGDLEALGVELATAAETLADRPLTIDTMRARLLRHALSNITGYLRLDLSPGLRDLRRTLEQEPP